MKSLNQIKEGCMLESVSPYVSFKLAGNFLLSMTEICVVVVGCAPCRRFRKGLEVGVCKIT